MNVLRLKLNEEGAAVGVLGPKLLGYNLWMAPRRRGQAQGTSPHGRRRALPGGPKAVAVLAEGGSCGCKTCTDACWISRSVIVGMLRLELSPLTIMRIWIRPRRRSRLLYCPAQNCISVRVHSCHYCSPLDITRSKWWGNAFKCSQNIVL